MKKMIAVDLDGTFLNSERKYSTESFEYLQSLKKQGYIVTIATGRILSSAFAVTNGASFANYIICHTGALIYDVDNREIIYKEEIRKDLIRKICECYEPQYYKYIEICDLNYYHRFNDANCKEEKFTKRIDDVNDFIENSESVMNMSIVLNKGKITDALKVLKPRLNGLKLDIMQDSFGDGQWIEALVENVSKYNAIKKLASLEKIENEDIIAFGDGRNDMDMIENCGVGVAMGNALEDLKKVSKYITLSNNEDGVIAFLKEYLS